MFSIEWNITQQSKKKNYQLMDESQNSYHQWNMADWKKKEPMLYDSIYIKF